MTNGMKDKVEVSMAQVWIRVRFSRVCGVAHLSGVSETGRAVAHAYPLVI